MLTKLFYINIILLVCLTGIVTAGDEEYVSDELIVTFAPKLDGKQMMAAERSNVLAAIDGVTIKDCSKEVPGMTLVKLPAGLTVEDAVKIYGETDGIIHVQPNYIYHEFSNFPNEPNFTNGMLWGLHNTGQYVYGKYCKPDTDIDAPEAWDVNTTCTDKVVVALIDGGIDYTHPELAPNMWKNLAELNGITGKDDDNNGYVDDIYGYDFCTQYGKQRDADPIDDRYHGTHLAGIIGAISNDEGVVGVCWNVKIMAIKLNAAEDGSFTTYDAVPAITYADKMGAKVINASWGGIGNDSDLLAVINAADANGILFVAAAGNSGNNNDTSPVYPASFPCANILAVMATNEEDNYSVWGIGSWSNYGATSVDLAAPGSDILSTFPTYQTQKMIEYGFPTNYYSLGGTSMSAAYVSGACALVWSENPGLTHLQVKNYILNGVDHPVGLISPKKLCATEGRLNLNNAIRGHQTLQTVHNRSRGTNYYTLTKAVSGALNGNLIEVDEGTYYENIYLASKSLTIKSTNSTNPSAVANTIIDGFRYWPTFDLDNNSNTVFEGLTIRSSNYKECLSATSSNVNIVGCCFDGFGTSSGIHATYGNITVRNCLVENCSPCIIVTGLTSFGAYNNEVSGSPFEGIYLGPGAGSLSQIYNNVIYDNATGIKIYNSEGGYVTIRNNTIVENGDGIYLKDNNNRTTISNCIAWYNDWQIYFTGGGQPTVTYSCVKDGYQGTGNINPPAGPGFVDSTNGNYHLKFGSPCIDANNSVWTPPTGETDIDGEQRVLNGDLDGTAYVDMGADEYRAGDFNHDGIVNFKDFAPLAKVWDTNWVGTNPNDLYDINEDDAIDYEDLDIFVNFWLTASSGSLFAGEGEQMQGEGLGDGLELDSGQSQLLLDGEGQGGLKLSVDGVVDPNGPIVLEPNETASIGIWGDGNAPPYCYYIGFDVEANASMDITYAEILYEGDMTMIEMVDDTEGADLLDVSNPFIAVELIDLPMDEDPLPLGPGQLVDDITFAGTGTLMLFDGDGNLLHSIVFTSSEP